MQTMKVLKFMFTTSNENSDRPIEYIEEVFDTEDGLISMESSLFVSIHLAIFGSELDIILVAKTCLFV